MQINNIQPNNLNSKNTNFGALKKVKFKGYYKNCDARLQQKLLNALHESKAFRNFFNKYDGTVTFEAQNGFSGLGIQSTFAYMDIKYKTKNDFLSFMQSPKCFTLSAGENHYGKFYQVTKNLANTIKHASTRDVFNASKNIYK